MGILFLVCRRIGSSPTNKMPPSPFWRTEAYRRRGATTIRSRCLPGASSGSAHEVRSRRALTGASRDQLLCAGQFTDRLGGVVSSRVRRGACTTRAALCSSHAPPLEYPLHRRNHYCMPDSIIPIHRASNRGIILRLRHVQVRQAGRGRRAVRDAPDTPTTATRHHLPLAYEAGGPVRAMYGVWRDWPPLAGRLQP